MPIWEDIKTVLLGFINGGKGFSLKVAMNATGSASLGVGDQKIAENQDHIFPAITLVNQSSSSIRWGYGIANQLMPSLTVVTLRYKNPRLMQLVYNDMGNSGELDVFS